MLVMQLITNDIHNPIILMKGPAISDQLASSHSFSLPVCDVIPFFKYNVSDQGTNVVSVDHSSTDDQLFCHIVTVPQPHTGAESSFCT